MNKKQLEERFNEKFSDIEKLKDIDDRINL